MFWLAFGTGAVVGVCLCLSVLGLCQAAGRADLEMELILCQEKIRRILRGELPNDLS